MNSVAFSADGRWLATGSDDRTARLWALSDDAARTASSPILLPHDADVDGVVFSPARSDRGGSSRWLATASDDSTARLFDLDLLYAAPQVLGRARGAGGQRRLRWRRPVAGDRQRRRDRPPVGSRAPVHRAGRTGPRRRRTDATAVTVDAIAFSADGRRLATGTNDKVVRLWDVDDPSAAPKILRHPTVEGYENAGITALAFSPNGRWLATGSGDRIVRLWDLHETSDDSAAPGPGSTPR